MTTNIPSGTLPSNKLDDQTTYDPNRLLDALIEKLLLKNDAALSRLLGVSATMLSRIRHRRLPIGATLLIRMHEVSGLTIAELRALMGDHRKKFSNGTPASSEENNGTEAR